MEGEMKRLDLYIKVEVELDETEKPEKVAEEICRVVKKLYVVRKARAVERSCKGVVSAHHPRRSTLPVTYQFEHVTAARSAAVFLVEACPRPAKSVPSRASTTKTLAWSGPSSATTVYLGAARPKLRATFCKFDLLIIRLRDFLEIRTGMKDMGFDESACRRHAAIKIEGRDESLEGIGEHIEPFASPAPLFAAS